MKRFYFLAALAVAVLLCISSAALTLESVDAVAIGTGGETADFAAESTAAAIIGAKEYATVAEAFLNAEDGDTVTLNADWTLTDEEVSFDYETTGKCAYLYVADGKSITLDLNGKILRSPESVSDTVRYDIIANYGTLRIVDSAPSKGMIEANNITGATSSSGGGFAVVSYGNLIIDGAVIDGNNVRSYAVYIEGEGNTLTVDNAVISGRGGIAVYNGANAVINSGRFALDVQTTNARDNVLYLYNATATVNGGEFDATAKILNDIKKGGNAVMIHGGSTVNIYGGSFDASETDLHAYGAGGMTGTVSVYGGFFNAGLREHNSASVINIAGGSFSYDPSAYLADGYVLISDSDGSFTAVDENKIIEEIKVVFEKSDADDDSITYDIVLKAVKESGTAIINRLNSADLTFLFTATDSAVAYELLPGSGIAVTNDTVSPDVNRYMFNFRSKDGADDTSSSVIIAKVKISGYGKFSFVIDAAANDTNAVHATELADNIVSTFRPEGQTSKADTGLLDLGTGIAGEIKAPTQKLTVNISFPNIINDNEHEYQNMLVTVSGSTLSSDITCKLGTDVILSENAYSVEIADILVKNQSYTVTVTGAGYRTAHYTLTMTEDKTIKFWNNLKDAAEETEVGKTSGKATANFLAGDIVADNDINIYDLSAVVSYFGTDVKSSGEYGKYVKYDLNRDGVIDSKDVAYVLVSWEA